MILLKSPLLPCVHEEVIKRYQCLEVILQLEWYKLSYVRCWVKQAHYVYIANYRWITSFQDIVNVSVYSNWISSDDHNFILYLLRYVLLSSLIISKWPTMSCGWEIWHLPTDCVINQLITTPGLEDFIMLCLCQLNWCEARVRGVVEHGFVNLC